MSWIFDKLIEIVSELAENVLKPQLPDSQAPQQRSSDGGHVEITPTDDTDVPFHAYQHDVRPHTDFHRPVSQSRWTPRDSIATTADRPTSDQSHVWKVPEQDVDVLPAATIFDLSPGTSPTHHVDVPKAVTSHDYDSSTSSQQCIEATFSSGSSHISQIRKLHKKKSRDERCIPYTTQELHDLMRSAEQHVSTRKARMRPTEWLSRNGPHQYFTHSIMKKQKGKLTPTLKDVSGHQKNPLNGRYSGVFFIANVEKDGLPKPVSPYGPRRLMIPAYALLNDCLLYFCDFYCLKPKCKHYVLLVAAKPGSNGEKFCEQNLIQLDECNNPFLVLDDENEVVLFNDKVWIQVMYSHNINVKHWVNNKGAYFYNVEATGIKSKKGMLKREGCSICEPDEQHSDESDVYHNNKEYNDYQ